jgi:probable aminopeptidase NPEPL1
VIEIHHVKNVAGVVANAGYLLVIAPKSAFSKAKFPPLFDEDATQLLLEAAAEVTPGDTGGIASTLTGGKPKRIAAGVLPNGVSRHNSPTRAESIRHVVAAAPFAKHPVAGLVIVLDDADHALAAINAVGRALPRFSAKTTTSKTGAVGAHSGASGSSRGASLSHSAAAASDASSSGARGAGTIGRARADGGTQRLNVLLVGRDGHPIAVDREIAFVAEAARDAAHQVDMPPSELHPAAYAREARRLLRIPGVTVREFAGAALLRQGLGAIHAVGRCARSEPRMLLAEWKPRSAKGPHIALVGKGVTYDTGGLHLKARGGMEGMKCDMGGAAAVLGAFRALARARHPGRVTLVCCMAENAIGPDAYKPDDIVTMHSGKTVEINNTDAEGRLLLADGVSYAVRALKADIVLDAATLTGAQLIATGLLHAAVITNDEELERLAVDAGRRSGDLVHPLPFAPEFYQREFQSPVADMRNSVKNRNNAQSSCAAQFVYAHIAESGVRWLHIDLAGPAWRADRGTGFGVALLATLVGALQR